MSKADNLITITSAVSIGLSSFVVGQALALVLRQELLSAEN
jgi:hypothetical protein